MAAVEVKFMGSVLKPVESKIERLSLEGISTVKDLLERLSFTFKDELGVKLLMEDGTISRHIFVVVNGVNISHVDGLDTRLKDKDRVSIVPALIGGGFCEGV